MRKRRRLLAAVVALLLAAAIVLFFVTTDGGASLGASAEGERLARMEASPRWAGGGFENDPPVPTMDTSKITAALRSYLDRGGPAEPQGEVPLVEGPGPEVPPASGLRLRWLGHSTVLFEIDGARILTDPIFSDRASPSTLVGPHRFHPLPVEPAALPPLDAVLLSHDHYDHLDMETVRLLAAQGVPFFAPLGVGAHLERWGVPPAQIHEFDWWQEAEVAGVRLVATPSQHFSGRGLLDRNATLWTSWSLVGPRHRVFFSGDTGLTPLLGEVGTRLGPFDVALFEIGAFHPAWGTIHLGPDGALEALRLVQGRALLPIHWATFDLGPHPWAEPPERLFERARAAGVRLLTPQVGEVLEPALAPPPRPWWRHLK
ncbi:MBL fold metallo-hydrolase [Vulgatibacter sp.]|uniref:MBL fold metallo-hydrolase n=1 Tax=Vulgatibacter sp. TaxID=1971226 RepID=UPI00356426B8